MDLLQQLQNAGREFAELRRLMKHAESLDLAPNEREMLLALGTALDGAHADMQKHGPDAIAELARREKELVASVKESGQALTQMEQEVQTQLAKAPSVPAPPPAPRAAPIDPQHGRRLAMELLESFTDRPASGGTQESRSVAEMASAEFRESDRHSPPSAPRPSPELRRADSDDWRFSSGNWEQ